MPSREKAVRRLGQLPGALLKRGKLFQRLFEGDAYKRVEELRNLESMTATAAVEGYGIATGTEEVPPEIAEMLRHEARKKFVENLPAEDADLFMQARGIEDLSPEHAERWRSLYGGLMQERGAEAAAFDERHGKKPRARRAAAAPAAVGRRPH